MKPEQMALTDLAADLRLEFDQTFATAQADISKDTQGFLAIGVGGDNYALRLTEIAGLFADKKITPLPSRSPSLLGIASFRGVVVPVYDLRSLLGYPAGPSPRWMVLLAPDAAVGLAFDRMDGYLDLPPEAIAHEAAAEPMRRHITETLRADNGIRSIVSIASILEMIRRLEPQM